jgi:universal stress protein E
MGKILVVADQGESCVATSRGLELAARLGHSVEVAAFTYAPLKRIAEGKAEQDAIKQQLLDKRRQELDARIQRFVTPGQKVALKVVWLKDIHPWINKRAATAGFDLVIKTAHDSGSMTYTSTDWHLLRECPAPVLLAAEDKWHRTKPVLAALDLGTRTRVKQALNDRVLGEARQLADALGVELRIISAIEIPAVLSELDLVDPLAYVREHREDMLPHLRKLAETHGLPEKMLRTKRGPVAKVITSEAAKCRAQIVVMGCVGRKGLKAQLLGNTAEEVLRHLRTDVLALKPA